MRKQYGVSLKLLLIAFTVFSVAVGLYLRRTWQPKIQQRNVAALKKLGRASGGAFTAEPFINVWYDNELIWNEPENRYVVNQNVRLGPDDDVNHHPLAIEICCNPDAAALKSLLEKLSTVKQIWKDDQLSIGNLIGASVDNQILHEWFPNRIIANVQPKGRRYSDDELE